MAIGYELLQVNNNRVPGTGNQWVLVPVEDLFSDPSDIRIVALRVIANAAIDMSFGVRHPDETTYTNITNIKSYAQTYLFCGARWDEGNELLTIAINRSWSQSSWHVRILGGIKSDSCVWLTSGLYSFQTGGLDEWHDINIYNSSSPPPQNARFAIVEARAPGVGLGFRSPYDQITHIVQAVNSYSHFLVPVRSVSSTDIRCRLYDSGINVTLYVRGWILGTNPGFFYLNNPQDVSISTTPSNQSISVTDYDVEGGIFHVIGEYAESNAYQFRICNESDTYKDNFSVSRITNCIAKSNEDEEVETACNTLSGNFTIKLMGVIGLYTGVPPEEPGEYETFPVKGMYREGTVSVDYESNMVIGHGTQWLTNNIQQGCLFKLSSGPGWYRIYDISSETQMELLDNVYPWDGLSVVKSSYAILQDFTPNFKLPLIATNDVSWQDCISLAFALADSELYESTLKKSIIFEPQPSGRILNVWNEMVYQPNQEFMSKASRGLVFFDSYRKTLLVCLGTATSAYPSAGLGNPIWIQVWGRVRFGAASASGS